METEPCTARVYDFSVLARLSRKMEDPLYPSGISSFTLRHIAFVDRLPQRYAISVGNIQSRLTILNLCGALPPLII
jgi:hypothetical protein